MISDHLPNPKTFPNLSRNIGLYRLYQIIPIQSTKINP